MGEYVSDEYITSIPLVMDKIHKLCALQFGKRSCQTPEVCTKLHK